MFKDYKILAAYDTDGNLQGVAAVKWVGQKGIAAKVDYLVSAFWNMPFHDPRSDLRTKGAGTCLLKRLTEILPTKGAIFLEPTETTVKFYDKRCFKIIPNWAPKTDGACCGMALYPSDFEKMSNFAREQEVSCKEEELPPTVAHFLEYSPKEIVRLAVEKKRAENKSNQS